jgi:hypothetical protein
MRTENLAGAGRNSPVMQCETGILGGHSMKPSRRLINTTLDAILILSNTDRIKTHDQKFFHWYVGCPTDYPN